MRSSYRSLLVIAVGGLLVLAGCGGSSSSTTPTTAGPRQVDLNTLVVGDCFDAPASAVTDTTKTTAPNAPPTTVPKVTQVSKLDCGVAHDAEVIGIRTNSSSSGAPYPGADVLHNETKQLCDDTYQAYDGVAQDSSSLTVFVINPSDTSWPNGDRTEICAITPKDTSKLTGSVKGTKK
jgi:hypothetical protein